MSCHDSRLSAICLLPTDAGPVLSIHISKTFKSAVLRFVRDFNSPQSAERLRRQMQDLARQSFTSEQRAEHAAQRLNRRLCAVVLDICQLSRRRRVTYTGFSHSRFLHWPPSEKWSRSMKTSWQDVIGDSRTGRFAQILQDPYGYAR